MRGLAILRVRSPLLTESPLFSSPTGTEMFHFPAFPPPAIHSPAGNTTSLVLGYPIRTSSDPRSVDNSPRHIAASHVLHRLPMPRHPPCALTHLHTTKKSHKTRHTPTGARRIKMLATTIQLSNTTPHHQVRRQHTRRRVASGPNSVPGGHRPALPDQPNACCAPTPTRCGGLSQCSLERR